MSIPLPQIPRPQAVSRSGEFLPPWQSWFNQLYVFLTQPTSGGGGIVSASRRINTLAPLAGGGTLASDLTLSVSFFRPRATAALGAGASNNLTPSGAWPANVGRLILTAPAGTANVTGLLAGTDGQEVFILNNDATHSITLNNQNTGSAAANRFISVADLAMPPGGSVVAVYDATLSRWML